jgi:hypothetical protein
VGNQGRKEERMKLVFSFLVTIFVFCFHLFGCTLAIAQLAPESSSMQSQEQSKKMIEKKDLRLTELFIIGEKAVGFESLETSKDIIIEEGKIYKGVRSVKNFGIINAFSIIDVKLRTPDWIIPLLEEKKYNILLVAELKKRGEDTWNRISVVNRYTWEIKKSTLAEEKEQRSKEEVKTEEEKKKDEEAWERIRPFYVAHEILSDNPFLREGDKVVVLFFYDVKRPTPIYLDDLKDAQQKGRSLITIDAQNMYLVTTGNTPQRHSAKDGDEIRLRFFRAEYSIKREKQVENSLSINEEPKPPAKYGDIVNVEDEMHFIFKKFGIKLNVSPIITFASLADSFDINEFNPISKTTSLGSNVYLSYDGRNKYKNAFFNYLLPGVHFSLLGLKEPKGTKFTLGIIFPIIPNVLTPNLRKFFGIFYGWHDLKDPVFGLTFSPAIDFRTLVRAEGKR